MEMSFTDDNLCRLCFNMAGNEFEVIEETVREIFNILLLQINLDITNNPVICCSCADVVLKCFYFKSRCLDTEELILNIVIEKKQIGFELKDIYKDNIDDFNVCRFCMNRLETSNFIALDSLSKEVALVETLMPLFMSDLEIDIVKSPVVCTACVEKLKYYLKFAQHCLNVEEKIITYCRDRGTSSTSRVPVREFKFIYNELQDDIITTRKVLDNKKKDFNEIPLDLTNCPKCEKCTYKTKEKYHIKHHMLTHENIPYIQVNKLYKCVTCPYTSSRINLKHKRCLKYHILKHGKRSNVETFKCAMCSFETRYKSSLKYHLLGHKDNNRSVQ